MVRDRESQITNLSETAVRSSFGLGGGTASASLRPSKGRENTVTVPALVSSGSGSALLPLGRHRVSLADVEARFVADRQFTASVTRQGI